MSYLVAHMQKMKAGNLVGIGNHIDRKTENHSNEEIDPSRSHLNYDLIDRDKNLHRDVTDYIEKNKSNKKITRKDAVLINSWVISSDQNFFKDLDQEQQRKFFEEAKTYFAERFGSENISYATVHLDETTPHMHLGIVPFDSENRLAAKRVFDRKTLEEIQADLPEFLRQKGFDIERGQKNSERVHLDTPEYKATMKQLKETKRELQKTKEECKVLSSDRKLLADKVKALEEGLTAQTKINLDDLKGIPKTILTPEMKIIEREVLDKLVKRDQNLAIRKKAVEEFRQALSGGGSYKEVMENKREAERYLAEAQQKLEQAKSIQESATRMYQEQLTLNRRFQEVTRINQELGSKLKEAEAKGLNLTEQLKALKNDKMDALVTLKETVQAMNMLAYDRDGEKPGKYLADLTKDQKNLLDKITDNAMNLTKSMGMEDLTKAMDENINIAESILSLLKPTKIISHDWGLEL